MQQRNNQIGIEAGAKALRASACALSPKFLTKLLLRRP